MKLHLPLSLRSSLLAFFAVVVTGTTTQAANMHRDASIITYADFGQNVGRYSVGVTNELLQQIRRNEGGVTISYTGGQESYVLPHEMLDFGSAYHLAIGAAISPSAIATVAHNYTYHSSFTQQVYGIGTEHAITYKSIELGEGANSNRWNSSVFSHCVSDEDVLRDHRVTRLSKIVTDAPYAEVYDVAAKGTRNLTYYHAGSGQQWFANYSSNYQDISKNGDQLCGSGQYVTGGIVTTDWHYKQSSDDVSNKAILSSVSFYKDGLNASNPLTWSSTPGDSGSPLYVWDKESQTYQYIGANRGDILTAGYVGSVFVMDTNFDKQVLESYTKHVDMGSCSTVYLNAVAIDGGKSEVDDRGYSTTKWMGTVSGEGLETVSFVGLKTGLNTWADLSGLKDTQNWYAYGTDKVIQKTEDLFFTENLVFSSASAENSIVLKDTVDLGVGYAEFCTGGEGSVSYTISSEKAANGISDGNLLNSAGFVVNSGVSLHLQLTNTAEYMREWRKIGAGDLYIEGSGNNDILLNVGGAGKTYLNREGGYAAYNVLVNNGSTIIIKDVDQIKRDLTFGNRGGTLNMNGLSMDWYATAEAADEKRTGFSINALTEAALIANDKGNSTLTYKETKDSTYVGSFADTATASLKIEHDSDATWTLNSIYTNLQHQDSGLLVNRGTVVLEGTNTVHGTGSATGENSERYFNEDDWHYADARMNVTVNSGTFELGSHARLTGNVTVQQGGTFVMREGVRHQLEYVEGGAWLEDTSLYSAYFGHKGNVQLNGGTFAVQFNEGADSTLEYAGNVKHQGSMTVDTGAVGGTLNFSGTVDAGVSKTLELGQLVLTGAAAADTSNKWLVNAGGVMLQFDDVNDTLGVIDTASTGVIGLQEGVYAEQFDFSATHSQLGIGALAGQTVQYGAEGTTESLRTLNLGGGGKLVVNYVLSGADTLNVDAGGMRGGEVSLQQVAEGYSGTVNVQSEGGQMTLTTAQNGALDAATVNLNAGGVWKLAEGQSVGGTVNINHGGLLETDSIIAGTVNVNSGGLLCGADVALTGGSVELSGNMAYDSFTVTNGATLNLRAGGRLDADKAATIAEGGIMLLNTQTLLDKVELKNGGIMYGNGGTIGAEATVLAAEGTGILSGNGGTLTINGQIGASEGATLRLENGTVKLHASSVNAAGGVLQLASSSISLQSGAGSNSQSIQGMLEIAADMTLNADKSKDNNAHNDHIIEHLHLDSGKSLKLKENYWSWSHTWEIGRLTGEGSIEWRGNAYWFDKGTSRLLLTGENDFEGRLDVIQDYRAASYYFEDDYSFQHVSLEHEKAAQNMVINLEGCYDAEHNKLLARPGLAVNTSNALVRGLEGNAYSELYAGSVKTNVRGDAQSDAHNTLTIIGSDNYTFEGIIRGDSSKGLDIVMNGTDTQTFTNAANVVHDIASLRGHLNFTAAPTIHGDISIAQGAQMTIGSGAYTLDSGHTLNVLAGEAGEQAVLNNALVLNGGTLHFSAYGDSAATAALSTNGVSGAGATISFSDAGAVAWGETQWLASGDWSSMGSLLTVSTPEYLNATLTAGSQGLSAAFSLKDGYYRWGDAAPSLSANDTVVFMGGRNAEIVEAFEHQGTGLFDSASAYTVSGESLSLGTMVKSNSGELVLNAAVAAGSLRVEDASTISGSGSLTVSSLEIQANLTTGMAVNATTINFSNGASWTLDGTQNAFTQNWTLEQLNKLGAIRVEGAAILSLDMGDANGSITADISGTGKVNFTNGKQLTKDSNKSLSIGSAEVTKLTLKGGGTTSISGVVTISGDGTDNGLLSVGKGTLELLAGAQVSTTRFVAGDTANDQPSAMTIGSGASLTITGEVDADSNTNSFMLTHWPSSSSTLVLDGGTLTAEKTRMLMGWDSKGTFEARSGVATLKGILFTNSWNQWTGKTRSEIDTLILDKATLNIGSGGITGIASNDVVKLGNGTIAATADFSISGAADAAVNLVGAQTGTTFDTNGKTITVNAVLQGDGKLVKRGAGTLVLQGENQYTGDTTVEAGVLRLESALGSGKYVVQADGTLELGHMVAGRTIDGSENWDIAGNLTLKGGTGFTKITGALAIDGNLSLGAGSVQLLAGAAVTADRFVSGDTANDQPSAMTIGSGASLTITGEVDADSNTNSFMLTHWNNSASTLVLDGGTLTAEKTSMLMGWDSGGKFHAKEGVATLKGIRFTNTSEWGYSRTSTDTLILENATLNIGSGGISGFAANDTVELGNGTIAATADFSISANGGSIQMVGETLFDTNGHTITIESDIQGSGLASFTGGGSLVKNSVGSLNLKDAELTGALIKGNGTTTISGEMEVSGILDFGTETVILAKGADVTANQFRMGTSDEGQHTNVSIGEGATLSVTGTTNTDNEDVSFLLAHWKHCASTLSLDGGTLNADDAVMHMGWDSGGTFQANSGEAHLKGILFRIAGDSGKNNAGSFILGTETTGTASVSIGSEGIKGFKSDDTVKLGNGTIVAADDFSIQGDSSIKLYGTADTGTVFDANGHTITINAVLDAEGGGGSSAMTVRNGTVKQSGNMWIQRLNIAEGAAFVKDGVTVQGLSEASVIKYLGDDGVQLDYSGNANHEISDAAVQVNSVSEKEVKTKLTNTSVENAGSGLLTLSNSGNTLSGLHATGGNIKVTGIETAAVAELEIAANKTITAANVVVNELAKLEAGATLAGNLDLANSATIELGGTVKLDGVLTLQAGLTLDGAVLDAVQGLDVGKSYTLFTGVNGLKVQSLQQAVTLYNMRSLAEQTNDAVSYSALMDGGQVAAADYFSNLTGNAGLVLSYNSAAGTVTITNTQAVPEPTTATLSLLALAGLCARRRRR